MEFNRVGEVKSIAVFKKHHYDILLREQIFEELTTNPTLCSNSGRMRASLSHEDAYKVI